MKRKKHMNNTKGLKAILSMVMAMLMTVIISVPTFASNATTSSLPENVNVKFCISPSIVDYGMTIPTSGYTKVKNMYESLTFTIDKNSIKNCPVVKPTGFVGLFDNAVNYVPTAFDAIYNSAVNKMGQAASLYEKNNSANKTPFMYGFDMQYTKPNENGIFVQSLSDLSTYTIEEHYGAPGENYWLGYSWGFYVVPDGAKFDPEQPNEAYKSEYYPNNIDLQANKTYYMIYELSMTSW